MTMLPDRHLRLLRIVWALAKKSPPEGLTSRNVSTQELLEYLEKDEEAREVWVIYRDPNGEVQSPRLVEGMEYLHRRGFVVMTPNGTKPTPKAWVALQR